MKKILMGVLLILMMFALVGCGEKAGGDSEKKDDSVSSSSNKFKGTTWFWEEYDEYTSWELTLYFNSESTGKLVLTIYGDGEKSTENMMFDYVIDSSDTSSCNMFFEDGDEGYAEIKGSKLYFYSDFFDDLILEKR